MPIGGEKGMACHTSRTYEERKQIQGLWEAGVQAKEIADKLAAPLFYCYAPQVLHRDREVFHSCVGPRRDIVGEVRRQLEREQITGQLIHL